MVENELDSLVVTGLLDAVLKGEDRQKHSYENGADETGYEEHHQRLQERDGGLQVAVEVSFLDVGDANELGVKPAAFLRDRNHLGGGAGKKDGAHAQARPELFAFLYGLDGSGYGVVSAGAGRCPDLIDLQAEIGIIPAFLASPGPHPGRLSA